MIEAPGRHGRGVDLGAAVFPFGDCKDACVGTLLRGCGIAHPEIVLFEEYGVRVEQDIDAGFRDTAIRFRSADALAGTGRSVGLLVEQYRAADVESVVGWARSQVAAGRAAVATVDHYEYEPSQFHRSGHMPHHVLLTGVGDDGIAVLDPYPHSEFSGVVTLDRLSRWVQSPGLGGFGGLMFTVTAPAGADAVIAEHLARTWRSTVERNVESMLSPAPRQGANALDVIADRFDTWIAGPSFVEDVRSRRKVPTTSFLEAGAIRRGHSRWLRQAAQHCPALAEVATDLARIGGQWDVVSAVRHSYQEAIGTQDAEPAPRLRRKVEQLPAFLRTIATAERRAATAMAAALRPGNRSVPPLGGVTG